MYSVLDYGHMIADSVRMDAYAEALRRTVRPGSVVADVGAGAGIMTLMACRLGAGKVYAIEPNDAIHLAREIARANGFEDHIEFIQELSTRVRLPERVDVIASDMRGILPIAGKHLVALTDARDRFLKPGGVLMPQRDTIFVAVVEAPEVYAKSIDVWRRNRYSLNMEAGADIVIHNVNKELIEIDNFLTEPQIATVLEYTTLTSPDFRSHLTFTARREGVAHGLQVWFDAVIVEGVEFSNAPGRPPTVYGRAFFPLSNPVAVIPGDEIQLALHNDLVNGDNIWRWNTTVRRPGEADRVVAAFRQSTFAGSPIAPAHVHKRSGSFAPRRNEAADIELMVLQAMDGSMPQVEIARRLSASFPSEFPTWHHALAYVGEKSLRYSR